LTGQKQDMTELKLLWLVNMTSHGPKIILSPDQVEDLKTINQITVAVCGLLRLSPCYVHKYNSNEQFLRKGFCNKIWRQKGTMFQSLQGNNNIPYIFGLITVL